MEFQLLGAVAATHGGEQIELGRRQERCLLGMLLLEAGRVVSADRLIALLWNDAPPSSSRGTLQTYITRLRARLARYDLRLISRGGGYVVEVDPLSVDVHRFVDQVDAARHLPDPLARAESLAAALALWQGPLLAGVADDDLRQRLGAGFEQQRLSALEWQAEAELEAHQHERALSGLTALVEQHPARERMTGLLMLAMYRCGRQADALAAYRTIRQLLVEEHGLEPGPELQQLHQQILTNHPGLIATESETVVHSRRFLPRDLPDFTGRHADLARLDAFSRDPRRTAGTVVISAIAGTGGVGKTALAVRWAHRVAARFPDGQLYINLRGFDPRGPMRPVDALATFLRSLDVPDERIPHDVDEASALFRSLLTGQKMLILLDNAGSAEQVRPLLPASPGCLVVVTSRDRMAGLVVRDGASRLTLDTLPPEDAVELLRQILGRERVAAEPAAAAELAEACGHLPLTLRIAAANLADRPEQSLADHVIELTTGDRLTELAVEGDPNSTIRAVFNQSYTCLATLEQRTFRLLGLIPSTDFAASAVAALTALSTEESLRILTTLADAHLIKVYVNGRFVMHDLLHLYARELALDDDADDANQQAVQRLLDHYLHTLRHTESLLDPYRDPISAAAATDHQLPDLLVNHDDALRWYSAERTVILALIDQAYAEGFDIHCWQMTWMTANFLERQGHWRDWAHVSQLAVTAAHRFGDHQGEARCLRTLARAQARLGQHGLARDQLCQALDIYRKIGDRAGEAYVHLNLNIVCDDQRRHEEALVHAEKALKLFDAESHPVGEALALNAIGWAEAHLGNFTRALTHCESAIELQQRHNHPAGEADTWDSVGHIHLQRGDHAAAAESYLQALHLFRRLGDRYNEATTLTQLGETAVGTGLRDIARDYWQQALDILAQLGHADAVKVRRKLGELQLRPASVKVKSALVWTPS